MRRLGLLVFFFAVGKMAMACPAINGLYDYHGEWLQLEETPSSERVFPSPKATIDSDAFGYGIGQVEKIRNVYVNVDTGGHALIELDKMAIVSPLARNVQFNTTLSCVDGVWIIERRSSTSGGENAPSTTISFFYIKLDDKQNIVVSGSRTIRAFRTDVSRKWQAIFFKVQ